MIRSQLRFKQLAAVLVAVGLLAAIPATASAAPVGVRATDATIAVDAQSAPYAERWCWDPQRKFLGAVRFWYIYDATFGTVRYVGQIHHRIIAKDTDDRGRIEANISWNDSPYHRTDVSNAQQDGLWHQYDAEGEALWWEPNGYTRHYNQVSVRFTFDDDDSAPDPGCWVDWAM